MKGKAIISMILLIFVGASVIVLFAKESNNHKPSDEIDIQSSITEEVQNEPTTDNSVNSATDTEQPPELQAKKEKPADIPTPGDAQVKLPANHKIIASYFHGNRRCYSCNTIGSLSEATFLKNFEQEMADGIVEWRIINVEEPANNHYARDYKLSAQSLILSYTIDGKEARWVNLPKVWTLYQNKEKFMKYVTDETREFMRNEK